VSNAEATHVAVLSELQWFGVTHGRTNLAPGRR